MKRLYSETIPTELGIKLQDAGMPIDWHRDGDDEYPLCPNVGCLTTYAEVLDWLMEKGENITVRVWFDEVKSYRNIILVGYYPNWFAAANAAIEEALKMMKEETK